MKKLKTVGTMLVLNLLIVILVGCGNSQSEFEGFREVGNESLMFDLNQWGELNTHDPAVIKEGNTYYVFSTDASYGNVHEKGIQIRRSNDLITWEYVGTAFDNFVEDCSEVIQAARLDVEKPEGLWAPDIVKTGDVFRMYYSASKFGSSRSCIGLAESKDIEGPYEHKGIVYRSEENAFNLPNAIDPSVIIEQNGDMYMSYGSFFGGIFLMKLDAGSGLADTSVDPVRIAGSRGASVEASCLIYEEELDYYYLFVSYGSLSSDYNVRVGRSRDITGPYLDAEGNRMDSLGPGNEEKVGTKLMGGYTFLSDPGAAGSIGYMAPGHNSVLKDGNSYYMIHHTRTYTLPDYWFYMNVRKMKFNQFGWPVVYPVRYRGEQQEEIEKLDGEYGIVEHSRDNNSSSHDSVRATLKNGEISGRMNGTYQLCEDNRIELILEGRLYDGIVSKQYDWEREEIILSFSAMSEDGYSIWGCTWLPIN